LSYTFNKEQINGIDKILQEDLIEEGVHSVVLIDMAGNIISDLDNGKKKHDVYSLAALAAGNFGAVSTMAKMIGEEDFSLLFHKGDEESIHFSKVMEDFLLITIFGSDMSLGFMRLKVNESIGKITKILESPSTDVGYPYW
jgi:predicted regulator of Ras-like GTPase activity (Roadblock/LC7/MglB family)